MINWHESDLLIGETPDVKLENKTKLICFDLDGTLIRTKSGKKFPKDKNDWVLFSSNISKKMEYLTEHDYAIVIITNQNGIDTGKVKISDWKDKITNIYKEISSKMKNKLELIIYCVTSKNKYRKPYPYIYIDFLKKYKFRKKIFCGDAGGREHDHSDTDYKFALNCDMKFYTPEHFFLNVKDECYYSYPELPDPDDCFLNTVKKIKLSKKEFIIIVGYPGSGKSTLAKSLQDKIVDDCIIINQDALKTLAKCLNVFKSALNENKSVIIDATNYTIEKRNKYLEIFNKMKDKSEYIVRCCIFDTSYELAMHNNHYRFLKTGKIISEVVYRTYRKYFEAPTEKEGFDEINHVMSCSPNDKLYKMLLY